LHRIGGVQARLGEGELLAAAPRRLFSRKGAGPEARASRAARMSSRPAYNQAKVRLGVLQEPDGRLGHDTSALHRLPQVFGRRKLLCPIEVVDPEDDHDVVRVFNVTVEADVRDAVLTPRRAVSQLSIAVQGMRWTLVAAGR
jgi:hypothetical protein